jgi:hypothetical protein
MSAADGSADQATSRMDARHRYTRPHDLRPYDHGNPRRSCVSAKRPMLGAVGAAGAGGGSSGRRAASSMFSIVRPRQGRTSGHHRLVLLLVCASRPRSGFRQTGATCKQFEIFLSLIDLTAPSAE